MHPSCGVSFPLLWRTDMCWDFGHIGHPTVPACHIRGNSVVRVSLLHDDHGVMNVVVHRVHRKPHLDLFLSLPSLHRACQWSFWPREWYKKSLVFLWGGVPIVCLYWSRGMSVGAPPAILSPGTLHILGTGPDVEEVQCQTKHKVHTCPQYYIQWSEPWYYFHRSIVASTEYSIWNYLHVITSYFYPPLPS